MELNRKDMHNITGYKPQSFEGLYNEITDMAA